MRLIDADAKELHRRINTHFGAVTRFAIKSILKDAPTIETGPVRGRWVFDAYTAKYGNPYVCSRCKTEYGDTHNFCPMCGADMRGAADG